MKKRFIHLSLLILSLLLPMTAYAAVGSINIDATSLNVGSTATLTVKVSPNDHIASADGTITSNDPTCVEVVSVTSNLGSGNYFAVYDGTGASLTQVASVKIKGLKQCSTTLKITNASLANTSLVEESGLSFTSGTITVNPVTPKNTDATLKALTISQGTLSPAFSPSTTSYTATVPHEVNSVVLTATKNDTKASVSSPITKTLQDGANTVNITVTAEDGTTKKTYTVVITREAEEVQPAEVTKSNDATLKSLEVTGHSFSPAFAADTLSYSMEVENSVNELDVKALANDSKATVEVVGNKDLKPGMNTISIKVVAEDGTTKIYTINVNKKDVTTTTTKVAKSSNNYLSNILLANGELSPKFARNTQAYDIKIPRNVDKLDMKVYAEDSKAKITINGNENLKIGNNLITIQVTAEDGQVRIYTLNVTKYDLEANTDLENLQVTGATYSPNFGIDVTYYESTVKGRVKQISVNGIPVNKNAKVEYYLDGNKLNNGIINLEEGYNLVTVKVTDENGFTKSYFLNVYRKAYTYNIFGIKIPKWLFWLLLFLLIGLIILIFILLYRRKRDRRTIEKEIIEKEYTASMPNIEFKPEFNFGSKNQDNDTAESGSVLNQGTGDTSSDTQDNDNNNNKTSSNTNEVEEEETPYDPYDEVVTVDELIDAIEEQDPKKLRILYEQELLNREKDKLRRAAKKKPSKKADDEDED